MSESVARESTLAGTRPVGLTESRPVGLTKDAGWEAGVRRTIAAPLPAVWSHLIGDGLPTWLGSTTLPTTASTDYATAEGTRGEIRAYRPEHRIRLTWQPQGWTHDSTVQVTVIPAATGTTIAFHHERLASEAERAAQLAHWTTVLDGLERELA